MGAGLGFLADDTKNANRYTPAQWALMEANGAVFLPFGGTRVGNNKMEFVNEMPFYWSSTSDSDVTRAYHFSYTGQWGTGSVPKSEVLFSPLSEGSRAHALGLW